MALCHFCGQGFSNRQAVRAHLKACVAYKGAGAPLPKAIELARDPDEQDTDTDTSLAAEEFDPVRQMRQSVAAEKLRLHLREIRGAHEELDARERASRKAAAERELRQADARQAIERAREEARAKVESERQSREANEAAKQRLATQRRETIQDVKRTVIEQWFGVWRVSAETKALMLQSIELALAKLPVQELPMAELVQVAEGVRDSLLKNAIDAERAIQEHVDKKVGLCRLGAEYASKELDSIEGLEYFDRFRIESRIKQELAQLAGDESRAEITACVDEILEEEGFGFEDAEEDGAQS